MTKPTATDKSTVAAPKLSLREHIDDWLLRNESTLLEWRRHLHRNPELSHMEYATTDFLVGVLESHGLKPQRFPGTGLMVDLGPQTGPKIAFRGDIDALPITETTGLPFSSQHAGVMHACGHDVHTSIALATAVALSSYPLDTGVRVIFQPAEEVMDGGASQVISWGGLDDVDQIFAVHAEPKLKVGRIGVRTGAITSASDILEIRVSGPGGHSSRPQDTVDVVYALSLLATQLPGLLSRRVDPRTGTVLVFGAINAGYAANAIPETGTISGTIRTADIKVWRSIEELLRELIAQILAPTGATFDIRYTKGVPPVLNDEVATALLVDAARGIDPNSIVEAPQSSGGEDFSWYLEHVPGSMARLGCWDGKGNRFDLHQSDLVVDERALAVGVRLFGAVAARFAQAARADELD
ncbi:M20 family metallopeptidase [Corynebacterium epidermidicanis]|uniref:Amidohydrolase n=1 Tax=Corynebacterium epidermidicanis TaxID=1050174 RepID=A0A0G3GSB2_9CORY|nr:M20 family metallopeptidase [Corynebacterium epidermidicanis]AKK02443.1 amidohydrolase [Corynebacterium epidermidicanis]